MAALDGRSRPRLQAGAAARRVGASVLCGLAVAACGQTRQAPAPHVRLHLASPTDGARVSTASVTVSGRVSPPGSTVRVLGRAVAVRAGSFSTQVSLAPGLNIIDVLAGATRATGVASAVRVDRYLVVTIPDLKGDKPSDAQAQLRLIGLTPQVSSSSDPFSFLLPLPTKVCSTSPTIGRTVPKGSAVTLYVAKIC